jgi:hypothetical protein
VLSDFINAEPELNEPDAALPTPVQVSG